MGLVLLFMAKSRTSREPLTLGTACKLAKTLAPEEIRPRDFVTQLYEVQEYPSLIWCDDSYATSRDELIRIQHTPENGGVPLKVKSVCLPFVLVKHPHGQQFMLDIRRVKLARLDREFAKTAWSSLRIRRKKRKKK